MPLTDARTENQKGLYIGIFWSIFNLGGVFGAAVSLGQNIDSKVCYSNVLYKPQLMVILGKFRQQWHLRMLIACWWQYSNR